MRGSLLHHYWKNAPNLRELSPTASGESKLEESSYDLYDSDGKKIISINFGELKIDREKVKEQRGSVTLVPLLTYPSSWKSHLKPIHLGGEAIAYLIPVSIYIDLYYGLEDLFDEEEALDDQEREYIELALIGLLEDATCIEYSRFPGDQKEGDYVLTDFYSPEIGILVIDMGQVAKFYPDMINDGEITSNALTEIKAQLLGHGYSTKYNLDSQRFMARYDWSENVSEIDLRRISDDVRNHLAEIYSLVDEASQASSSPVAFFLLYQVVEDLTFVIFDLLHSFETEKLQSRFSKLHTAKYPHDFKRRLGTLRKKSSLKLLRDNERIEYLEYFCNGRKESLHETLHRTSFDLYSEIERYIRGDSSYMVPSRTGFLAATYAVRNLVVHRQSQWIMSDVLLESLWNLNRFFLQAILDIICIFDCSVGDLTARSENHPNLEAFFSKKGPANHEERLLVFYYWLEIVRKKADPSYDEIRSCYDDIGITKPVDISAIVTKLHKKHHLKKTAKRGHYTVTLQGKRIVHILPEKIPD